MLNFSGHNLMMRQSYKNDDAGDRLFMMALTVSCLLHLIAIGYLSFAKNIFPWAKPAGQMQVTYVTEKKKSVPEKKKSVPQVDIEASSREVKILPQLKTPKNPELFLKSGGDGFNAVFGPMIKDISKMAGDFDFHKKQTPQIKTLDVERKISMPLVATEKISNPQYLTYNQSIRQKIMQRAYQYVDHPDFQTGEVYLTFILSNRGELRGIHVIEDKTQANDYLRQVALRSVREANPFMAFPQDLRYPELTFNVIISFEMKE